MNDAYERCAAVEAMEIEGEWILLNLDTFMVTKLNELGGWIWSLLQQKMTLSEIVAQILATYDVAEETASEDALRFLERLAEAGLIAPCAAGKVLNC